MSCRKTVTEKQLEANRANARVSTGPRTELGKMRSRRNAITHGLFATEIVPRIDGVTQSEYNAWVAKLRSELGAVGSLEEFYVGEVANSTILLRRVTLRENACIRKSASVDNCPKGEHGQLEPLRESLWMLRRAQTDLSERGGVSPENYAELVRRYPELKQDVGIAAAGDDLIPIANRTSFSSVLSQVIKDTESVIETLLLDDAEGIDNYYQSSAVPSEGDLQQIIRAERRAHKKLKESLRMLFEIQDRRTKLQH